MYKSSPNSTWYYFNGTSYHSFRNYDELINFIAQHNTKYGSEVYNPIFDYIGVNDNDVIRQYIRYDTGYRMQIIKRTYRIIHPDGYYIWNDTIKYDIIHNNFDEKKYREWLTWWRNQNKNRLSTKYRRYLNVTYPEFRCGPWPHIHNHHGRYYRQISVMNEKRSAADPEIRCLYRGSRGMNLPDPYDTEPCRAWRNRGWKRQGKREKQWMCDNRRHTGDFIVKGFNKRKPVEIDFKSLNEELCA